ncbi:phosphoribosylanthranilate isomerase [Alkalihalobacterium elongatum]|uniref:phosphoribosylanthranilate isomerase n=1 Tax=Alkalihalobacterium elongatum TaxID=2675466 RepID=UPI001C1F88E3|nr:phosphoribosylanthranilate isomerase [Alkalihalobacterium elongatum]
MQTKLKYCGNHSIDDTKNVLNSNADFVGFVFAESKRKVKADDVNCWLKSVPFNHKKQIVALFVNATISEIEEVVSKIPVDIIQCHGHETPELVQQIKQRVNKPIWKVIHHKEEAWQEMLDYAPYVEAFIIDSKVKGQWGGTGITFDWGHIPKYIEQGKLLKRPVYIAGGINPNNVDELLTYQPDGIDISSGIEKDGIKDNALIEQIEERIKYYDNQLSR